MGRLLYWGGSRVQKRGDGPPVPHSLAHSFIPLLTQPLTLTYLLARRSFLPVPRLKQANPPPSFLPCHVPCAMGSWCEPPRSADVTLLRRSSPSQGPAAASRCCTALCRIGVFAFASTVYVVLSRGPRAHGISSTSARPSAVSRDIQRRMRRPRQRIEGP